MRHQVKYKHNQFKLKNNYKCVTTLNLSPLTHAPNDLCRFVLTCFIELSIPLLFFKKPSPTLGTDNIQKILEKVNLMDQIMLNIN